MPSNLFSDIGKSEPKDRWIFCSVSVSFVRDNSGNSPWPHVSQSSLSNTPKSRVVLWPCCVAHEAAEAGRGVPQRSALLCSCGCRDSPRYKVRVSDWALSRAGYNFSSIHAARARSEFAVLWLFIIFSKGHEEDIVELAVLILGHTRDFTVPGTQL